VKLNSLKPMQIKVEYDLPHETVDTSAAADEARMVSIENIIKEYIDALDTNAHKQHVYAKCIELYQQFQN